MATENKKYIPTLRFPEFQNDGEWALTPIGKYYKVQGGFAFKSSEFKKSGIPIIRISNIPNDGIYIETNDSVYYDTIVNEDYFLISRGDLLIAMSGATTGKTAIYNQDRKAYLNQRVGLFKSINSHNYYPFICQWVKSNYFYAQLKRTLAAGAQPNISSKDIESFIWAYPNGNNSFAEQKKIADCLSSLDKYIDAAKRKLELLKEHKKGLMQRLFPAKGKTTPELRFPEFQNDGEWKNIKFSDLFTFISNNTLSRASLNNNGGIVQNIHYGDVLIKYKENLSAITEKIPFITDINDIQKYISVKMENGDIIIADTAEDEIVGKCTEIQDITKELIVAGLHTIAIRPNCKFAKYYLGFYLNSQSYRDQLTQYMQGVKVLAISKTSIAQTTICFPNSLVEQELIAKCLMEINNSLKLIEEKIKVLELHKKGLKQQLFPKL